MAQSENGWVPARVGAESLQWVTIPGTEVNVQFQKGQPLQILRAFAADYNQHVEPLRNADTASWTPTNSVPTSNHLNGTAMDCNWNTHPFRVKGTFTPKQMVVIRELLDFYEGTVFWAGDWRDPIDEMHWQLGYDTYGNPATADFIRRKIREDGYSTFQRGGVKPLNAVAVLASATGLTEDRAQEILPQVLDGLSVSECTTPRRIGMWLAQIGHESDNFRATEEYQDGDESEDRWRYKGRTWIQITWKANYAGFSEWCFDRGLVKSATYFVDNPTVLADQTWAGLGPAWYWTVARPQINRLCDANDFIGVTKAINGGTNGLTDRQARYDRAMTLGDHLLALTTTGTTDEGEGFLMALSDAEQREVLDLLRQQSSYRRPSRSPLRHVGEGNVETISGFAWNTDGSVHVLLVNLLARLGDPDSVNLLREVAALDPGKYPDRAHDRLLAQAILNDIMGMQTYGAAPPTGQTPGAVVVAVEPPAPQPAAVPLPTAPGPAVIPPVLSSGDGVTSAVGNLGAAIESLKSTLDTYTDQLRS